MALGVAFGLFTSLMLKHSYLHLYPSIESCLVALSAYTCYFFSNGLSMSGIVSLLFCGITLKHYAYHTMSRRTQRASKYIFSTLAQLSENFIFIYLGMSLFTSAPVSAPVFSYVRPVFILISLIAVVFTRYIAVFPLSEAINLFQRHARGQRQEEIPHSYQMMLFWAGLRGAVGVALAAGFKGPNAQMMRTTVLIVVVLTVVLFGGTTARMLEVLGIRTGVEDDTAFSSDEDDPLPPPTRAAWTAGGSARGGGNSNARWNLIDVDESASALGSGSRNDAGRIGIHYAGSRPYNHHRQHHLPPIQTQHTQNVPNNPVFSSASSDSYDSDVGEVLPLAPTSIENTRQTQSGNTNVQNPPKVSQQRLREDGKWFQAIDERYLLPIFSNATASRTFHARRARRSTVGLTGSTTGSAANTPADSEDEVDLTGQDVEQRGVQLVGVGAGGGRQAPAPHRSVSVEESRIERGLSSPVMRSNGGNGGS